MNTQNIDKIQKIIAESIAQYAMFNQACDVENVEFDESVLRNMYRDQRWQREELTDSEFDTYVKLAVVEELKIAAERREAEEE